MMDISKKTKLVILVILLVVLIILCRLTFNITKVKYKINFKDEDFDIQIKYDDYTHIKIENNKVYTLILPKEYFKNSKNKKIITDIYYYNDQEYECILPIINDSLVVDMMCYVSHVIYNYKDITGLNDNLDNYVKSIDIYDINKFSDDLENSTNILSTNIYNNQIKDTKVTMIQKETSLMYQKQKLPKGTDYPKGNVPKETF